MVRPMGICLIENGLVIAQRNGISVFGRVYVQQENHYIYRQELTKHTGYLDGHELVAQKGIPVLANTLFNCLSTISVDKDKDFEIFYQPGFVTKIAPEDLAHINGIAVDHGLVRYITCFSPTGEKSWRKKPFTGCVWDVLQDKPVIENLALPHSPRVINGNLFVCDSGRGRVLMREGNKLKEVIRLGSFTRGIATTNDYILVSTSKTRKNHRSKQVLEEYITKDQCAIHLFDAHSFEHLNSYIFEERQQIFDIQLIPENHIILTPDSKPFDFIHRL